MQGWCCFQYQKGFFQYKNRCIACLSVADAVRLTLVKRAMGKAVFCSVWKNNEKKRKIFCYNTGLGKWKRRKLNLEMLLGN